MRLFLSLLVVVLVKPLQISAFTPWADIQGAELRVVVRYFSQNYASGTSQYEALKLRTLSELERFLSNELQRPALYSDFTTSSLRAFVEGQTVAASTIQVKLAVIKRFSKLMSEDFGARHVARDVRGPKPRHRRLKSLTPDELASFMEAVAAKPRRAWMRERNLTLCCLMVTRGLRRGELLELNAQQVDLGLSMLRDVHGKRDRYDDLEINNEARNRLLSFMQIREVKLCEIDPVFAAAPDYRREVWPLFFSVQGGKPGEPDSFRLTETTINNIVRAGFKDADLELYRGGPHTLRRTFAKNLERAGQPISIIKELLRHESVETTMRYLAEDEGEKESALESLPPTTGEKA